MLVRNQKSTFKFIFSILFLLLTTAAVVLSGSCSKKPEPADLVILNARIYTLNPAQPWAEAVAIKGEKIVFVGSSREARRYVGRETRVMEAGGHLLLPGFQDSHVHFLSGSLNLNRVDLAGTRTVAEIQERIRKFVSEHPDLSWVQGRGWMYSSFPDHMPHKKYLDEVVPDRPAIMRCADGHTSWVNSKALALAGITRTTPDPPDGKIVRDEKGEPTGALLEGASVLVSRLIPEPTAEEKYQALKLGMKEAAKWGVTVAHGLGGEFEELELFERLKKEGHLLLRLIIAMWVGEPGPTEKDFQAYEEARARYNDKWLKVHGIKLMLDGVIDSGTAAMLAPYEGQPENSGKLFWKPEDYLNAVLELSRRGIPISTHSIGDRAIKLTLEAYEIALKESGHPELRHKIEHVECVAAEDFPRFAHPGIIASFQPLHADPDPVWMTAWIKNVGPEREQRAFPWKSVIKNGGQLAFGSDWPVVTINPWPGVQVAVTRQSLQGYPEGGWVPSEKLRLEEVILAYTIGGAYAVNEEELRGSIEPGKLADLILVSQNIFEIPANKISETRSLLTVVGGKIVHQELGN
ncbi:MAG: amidohydrolase [Candidatus Aminicenantes bacterium]|nr:amidohydrolase [Candidatus Aminicenantes bacterium]